jgi:hypothetical protein
VIHLCGAYLKDQAVQPGMNPEGVSPEGVLRPSLQDPTACRSFNSINRRSTRKAVLGR